MEDLRTKTRRILEELAFSDDVVLSIALVDASEMTSLNRQYRGKDAPTNVLSFSQREGAPMVGGSSQILGDVVIGTNVAEQQAKELGYTDEEMLSYLLIHGIVHLTGHTHEGPGDRDLMEAVVNDIFGKLYPPLALVPTEEDI
jgi:probable rRNA maturation factor